MEDVGEGELNLPVRLEAASSNVGWADKIRLVRAARKCRSSGAQVSLELEKTGVATWQARIDGFGTQFQLHELLVAVGVYER